MNKAILIVSYGTSNVAAIKQSIYKLKARVEKKYPDYSVTLAFSSYKIRKKLRIDYDFFIPSVDEAVAELIVKQTKELIVFPTHLLPGLSYEAVCQQLEDYRNYFDTLILHAPLLAKYKETPRLLHLLSPSGQRTTGNTAVLYVGHGTNHHANNFYEQLETQFHKQELINHFILTIDEIDDLSLIHTKLQHGGYTNLLIRPLLFVSGYHAKKDLCRLSEKLMDYGFVLQIDFRGLGEQDEFIDFITTGLIDCSN